MKLKQNRANSNPVETYLHLFNVSVKMLKQTLESREEETSVISH